LALGKRTAHWVAGWPRFADNQSELCLQNLVYFLIVVAVGGLGSIRGRLSRLLIGIADTGFKYLLPEFGAFSFMR